MDRDLSAQAILSEPVNKICRRMRSGNVTHPSAGPRFIQGGPESGPNANIF
jgi:hypothetical protein